MNIIRFIINDGKIAVIDWFGVRKRKYTLDPKQKLSISNEDPQYKFRFLRSDSKYNKIKVLRFQTEEGKKIKIQTRHYKNFEDMVLAINKEYNRLVTTLKK